LLSEFNDLIFLLESSAASEDINGISVPATQKIFTQIYVSGTSHTAFINGSQQGQDTSVGTMTDTSFELYIGIYNGQIVPLDGTAQELIFFVDNKSADRTDIESNIADYFNITI